LVAEVKAKVARDMEELKANPPKEEPREPTRLKLFYKMPPEGSYDPRKEPGMIGYMAHLERLNDVKVRVFSYDSVLSGDLWVEFVYSEHMFTIHNDWDGDLFLESPMETPEPIFNEVFNHLKNFRKVEPLHWLGALWRYRLAWRRQ